MTHSNSARGASGLTSTTRHNHLPLLRVGFLGLFGILAALLIQGCATSTSAPAPTEEAPEFEPEYRIGVGDNLQINVWRNPDLSVNVPVRPDGKISVPLAGDVAVGGKTPEEVADKITESISTYIREPFVTVIVTDVGSSQYRSRVRVTGAVMNPISVPYRQGMTVLDLVLESGGLSDFASGGRAVLFRASGDRLDVNLNNILRRGDMGQNYQLRPGDVITVPERAF
ncbi:MAG: XrtA/PEP-CTERM system exopolysaccharide export protein [Pseudomonadota bacterium]